MNKLQEIDEQLQQLNKARANLLTEENMKIVTSLEWTKDCFGKLEISPFCSEGLPKYEIFLYAPKNVIPYCSSIVCVMGDSKHYQENMQFKYFAFNRDCPVFYTSSDNMLFQFLEKVTFNKFEYDVSTLETLTRIKNISEKYAKNI
jgi:hypothetical protein